MNLSTFRTCFLLLLSLAIFDVSIAQISETTNNQSLDEQYTELIKSSETYNEYKVIKQVELNRFGKTIRDSISSINQSKKSAFEKINIQKAQIEQLTTSFNEKEEALTQMEAELNSINVLGLSMDKNTYTVISITIPFLLIGAIAVLFIRLKQNNSTTKEAKSHLLLVENEYEEYKKRALDKQMKLKRELQTERNKLLEITR